MGKYYERWLKYKRTYDKEHYKKTAIRKDLYSRLKQFCGEDLGLNECLEKLLRRVDAPDLCRVLEKAVRLANRFPEMQESQEIFEEYERMCLG